MAKLTLRDMTGNISLQDFLDMECRELMLGKPISILEGKLISKNPCQRAICGGYDSIKDSRREMDKA